MKTLIVLLSAISISICACIGSSSSYQGNTKKIDPPKQLEKIIGFDDMITLDKTPYVMFPLSYGKVEESDGYSSSSVRSESYWNIIFYNTIDQKYRLLDSTRRMVIYQYDSSNNSSEADTAAAHTWGLQSNKLMYYKVVTDDYNNDHLLDDDDPTYLFISDKDGNNFRQISPSGLKVTDWKVIEKSDKLLIETLKDINGDKKFTNEDLSVPYIYDLKTGAAARPVFDKPFNDQLKQVYKKLQNSNKK